MWQQWINGILALWVIASAFLGLAEPTQTWNLAIVGALIAILAFWGASQGTMRSA